MTAVNAMIKNETREDLRALAGKTAEELIPGMLKEHGVEVTSINLLPISSDPFEKSYVQLEDGRKFHFDSILLLSMPPKLKLTLKEVK